MKFFGPLLVWLIMAAIITTGILMAINGKGVWLMVLSFLGFIVLAGKFGCLTSHD